MAKILFDANNQVETPVLLLQNRNFDTYGRIHNVSDLTYKNNFNKPNEISFTVYKTLNGSNDILWSHLVDFKIVYIPEFKECFEITVSNTEETSISKSVTGTALAESELSNTHLYNIEINTETDIARDAYDARFPTVFYRDPSSIDSYDWSGTNYSDEEKAEVLRNSSLLHRLLEKASHYSIAHVDDTLLHLDYVWEFSISDTDIYSELTGEIAEHFGVMFSFDSVNRTVSVHDLYNTCGNIIDKTTGQTCGYRGDFTDKCPECGCADTSKFYGQYGDDTTILISKDNLVTQVTLETNANSLKNCFYLEAGDDTMTAAVKSLNPNGSSYIYYFSNDIKDDMPAALVNKINSYDTECETYMNTHQYHFNESLVKKYNDVVSYVVQYFPPKYDENNILTTGQDFKKITTSLTGYPATTELMYQIIDLESFVKTSMMPTLATDKSTLEESLDAIIEGLRTGLKGFPNTIGINDVKNTLETSIEKRIENTCKLFFNSGYYTIDAVTDTYERKLGNDDSKNYGVWNGTLVLTSTSEMDPETNQLRKLSKNITLTISQNWEAFIQNSIALATQEYDNLESYNFVGIDYDKDKFSERLHYYSYDQLENLQNEFTTLLNIVEQYSDDAPADSSTEKSRASTDDPKIDVSEVTGTKKDIYKKYHDFYFERLTLIESEKLVRTRQLEDLYQLYKIDVDENGNVKLSGRLYELRESTNKHLNFQNWLGPDLWKTFCSYRREDKYSNTNYTSEGLSNSKIMENANEFIKVAKQELYNAASLEYSISSSLNNLLAIPAFSPILHYFEVGNWLRVSVDEKLYRLRLLSYQIDFSNIQNITVEFSTVKNIWSGYSDIQSVIESASSIATSYDSLVTQVKGNSNASHYVKGWLQDGFNGTLTKFVNSDHQTFMIDENGLLARRYDMITEQYDNCQLKILSNGLYTTSDAWKTLDSGVGKFSYFDPDTGEEKIGYGVIAKTVIGQLILGNKLGIFNKSMTLKMDDKGLVVKGKKVSVKTSPDADYPFHIYKSDSDIFYVTSSGDGYFNGRISSSQGAIGNWIIDHYNLSAQFSTQSTVLEEVYVRDENGEIVYKTDYIFDQFHNPIYETDQYGNIIYTEEPAFNSDGTPIYMTDSLGNIIYTLESVTDENGNPVYDDTGAIKTQEVPVQKTIQTPVQKTVLTPLKETQEKKIDQFYDNYTVLGSTTNTAIAVGVTGKNADGSFNLDTAKICLNNDGNILAGKLLLFDGDHIPSVTMKRKRSNGNVTEAAMYSTNTNTPAFAFSFKDSETASTTFSTVISNEGVYSYVNGGAYCGKSSNRWKGVYSQSLDVTGAVTIGNTLNMLDDSGRKRTVLSLYRGSADTSCDSNLVIGACGNTFVGSGESAINLYQSSYSHKNGENLFLTSDNSIYLYTSCQDISKRVGIGIDTSATLYPLGGSSKLGTKNHKWNEVWCKQASINSTSDRKDKKDIERIKNGKELIMNIEPVQFKYKVNDSERTHYGIIAQQLKEAMDKAGIEDCGAFLCDVTTKALVEGKNRDTASENELMYGVRYGELIAPIIQVLQEQEAKLNKIIQYLQLEKNSN